MIRAMVESPVGDDGFGEDPTTNRLEAYCAELFGKEAAMFSPSGTMSNQLALRALIRPGDDVILDRASHFSVYESAPSADLAGVALNTVEAPDGILTPALIDAAIDAKCRYRPYAQARLVLLENTMNYHAGRLVPVSAICDVSDFCRANRLKIHLDGARLFNAAVATGTPPRGYGELVDTVSTCFAKGLGAPCGSILAGAKDVIEEARYYRKSYGGAMHQSGYMAGAALYALHHNIERLADDHENAQALYTQLIREGVPKSYFSPVHTNMIIIDLASLKRAAHEVTEDAAREGVLVKDISRYRLRLVTHLDVRANDIPRAASVIGAAIRKLMSVNRIYGIAV